MTHTYLEQTLHFNVVFKKRKSLGIYIDVYGNIELRVPKNTLEETLISLVESKWKWIVDKQREMKQRSEGYAPKTYEEGETFLYLGKSYSLELVFDDNNDQKEKKEFKWSNEEIGKIIPKEQKDQKEKITVVVKDTKIVIHIPFDQFSSSEEQKNYVQQAMKRFYYKECKRLVEQKIKDIQPYISVKPSKLSISDDKSKWGSCDSRRQLTFNWKLAMAPDRVIMYLVIHEMSHLEHLNHDRSFWRLVGKLMPDYEEQQAWLQNAAWKMSI